MAEMLFMVIILVALATLYIGVCGFGIYVACECFKNGQCFEGVVCIILAVVLMVMALIPAVCWGVLICTM